MSETLVIAGKTWNDVSGFKAYNSNGNLITYTAGNPVYQAKTNIHPSTSSQTIQADNGYTALSSVQINGVTTTNLSASNIKSGVTVKIGDSMDDDCVVTVVGTYSGPGDLLATQSLGSLSGTSTATDTGITVTVNGINNYDALLVESSRDSMPTKGLLRSATWIWLTVSADVPTKDGTVTATARYNAKLAESGEITTRANTTAYGVYPSGYTLGSNTITLPMWVRYNATATSTLNGPFTTRVYGIKLL